MQELLAPRVERVAPAGFTPRTVAGLDVAYQRDSDLVVAAIVTIELRNLNEIESVTVVRESKFPYISGLFAFRELPALLEAFERLAEPPDLLLPDGHGIAHPRQFGLASHLGIATNLPTIGVAKTALGHYQPPGPDRGSTTLLVDRDEEVGMALRTQDKVKPVFVSIGHRIDLASAGRYVLALTRRHRLPETTRLADQLARRTLREVT